MYDKSVFSLSAVNDTCEGNNQLSTQDSFQMYTDILRDSGVFILCSSLNSAVTLAAFPGVTVLIEAPANSTTFGDPDWNRKYFVAIFCFVLFNFSDYIGKKHSHIIFDGRVLA